MNSYEAHDWNLKWPILTILGVLGLILFGLIALFFYQKSLVGEVVISEIADGEIEGFIKNLDSQPVLEADPAGAWQNYLKVQKEILSTYEVKDRKQGIVRIPIETAIEIAIKDKIYNEENTQEENHD